MKIIEEINNEGLSRRVVFLKREWDQRDQIFFTFPNVYVA